MKNKKGVTLISLVVTIVVLSILISVATISGVSVLQSSKLTAFTTKMKIMQSKVNELYEKSSNNETITVGSTSYTGDGIKKVGKKIENEEYIKILTDELGYTSVNNYKYWDNDTINDLGIEGLDKNDNFLVDISSRSVVSCTGFKYKGNTFYTLEQLPDSLYNVGYSKSDDGNPTFNYKVDGRKVYISDITYNRIHQ